MIKKIFTKIRYCKSINTDVELIEYINSLDYNIQRTFVLEEISENLKKNITWPIIKNIDVKTDIIQKILMNHFSFFDKKINEEFYNKNLVNMMILTEYVIFHFLFWKTIDILRLFFYDENTRNSKILNALSLNFIKKMIEGTKVTKSIFLILKLFFYKVEKLENINKKYN